MFMNEYIRQIEDDELEQVVGGRGYMEFTKAPQTKAPQTKRGAKGDKATYPFPPIFMPPVIRPPHNR